MDNTNIVTSVSANKSNKILAFILLVVVVITLALVSFYLYTRYRVAKNNNVSVSQGMTTQNVTSIIPSISLILYTVTLPPAVVGRQYQFPIQVGIYNYNVQINGEVTSGLPSGLQLTPCSTEYDSPAIAKIATKNSFVKCTIEGIPQQSGNFTIKFRFSIKDVAGYLEKELPLTINP